MNRQIFNNENKGMFPLRTHCRSLDGDISVIMTLIPIIIIFCFPTEHVDSPGAATTQVILSCAANVGSVYLAYILYFILEDLCLVCVTSYIINAAILLCNWFRMNQHRTMTKHHTS